MVGPWRIPLLSLCCTAALLSARPALALDEIELKEMEGLLRDLGFDPGPVDGTVDDQTTEAIRQYKAFALAPGDPEPSGALLNELRGVAAAFAALNADKRDTKETRAAAPEPIPAPLPDLGAGPEPEPQPVPEPVAEKIVVPPPPPPPKLKPVEPEVVAAPEPPAQVAALPPADAAPEAEAEPVDATQAMLDEELAPFQNDLNSGAVTRAELAKKFNAEGRMLLQAAQYDDAIRKFSVAIFLDPTFAGAYSNRGTAWQRHEQPDLAKADFDKAKALGFGGFRVKDGTNPLN